MSKYTSSDKQQAFRAAMEEKAEIEKKLNSAYVRINQEKKTLAKLNAKKNQLQDARETQQLYEAAKGHLLQTIEQNKLFSMESLLAFVEPLLQIRYKELGVLDDGEVIVALESQKVIIKNEIIQDWLASDDYRKQMAVFRLVADNEELVRLNTVQSKERKDGDFGTAFDVRVVSNRRGRRKQKDIAEDAEIIENIEEVEDTDTDTENEDEL